MRALRSAQVALLAATAALPFHELTWRIGPVGLRPFEALLLVSALLAIPVARRDWLRFRAVDREVLALLLLGLVSLLVARGPGESVRVFRLVLLEPALFYLLLTRLALPARPVAAALVVGGVAAAAMGFVQLASGIGPIEAEGVDRIRAAYRSPNNLALFLDRVIPIAAALAMVGTGIVWGAAVVVMLVAQALTYSVGGWLATAAALAVVVAALRGRRALAVVALAAALMAAAVLAVRPERITSHLDLASDSTSGVRILLWRASLDMLRDQPLTGIGLDNFVHRYNPARGGDYMDPAGWREPDLSHPHNLLLDWWLSLGVVGALLLARLFVVGWRLARPAVARADPLAVGLVGALAATVVHGLFDNAFFLPDLAALWWASFALLASTLEKSRED